MLSSPRFTQAASTITDKVAQLLHAPVFVTDNRGIIITSSEPHWIGLTVGWEQDQDLWGKFLRIPFQHDSRNGEVIVGESSHCEAASPRLARALVELVISQTALQDVSPSSHELKNQFIADLLHDRVVDHAALLERSQQLGIDLAPPRAVILIDASRYILAGQPPQPLAQSQRQRVQAVIRSIVCFFHLPNDTICTDLGQGEVVVLKASDSKNLDKWAACDDVAEGLGSSWANLAALRRAADSLLLHLRADTGVALNVGIGRYHPGVRGLARSYEDARAALSLGLRFRGGDRVHCLGELGIAAFVGIPDENTKVDLARYLLSPLDHEPELLGTLDAFFAENCCPSSTAKRLSIHRNTLSYRLNKIHSLTGLEARRFDDAVQMRLALLLRSPRSGQAS